jgi:hypothetical protein
MVTFPEGTTPLQELHSHLTGHCGEGEDLSACFNRVRELVEALMPEDWNEEATPPPMPSDAHFRYVAGILAPVFASNGWLWNEGDGFHVPSAAEIEQGLRDQAASVADGADWCASGRLLARVMTWRANDREIRLGLEITYTEES